MFNGLSMTAADVANWARVHQRAGSFWGIAADDYVAARCCILNGSFTGFVLGAQAAEKYLKACLLFHGTRQGPSFAAHIEHENRQRAAGQGPGGAALTREHDRRENCSPQRQEESRTMKTVGKLLVLTLAVVATPVLAGMLRCPPDSVKVGPTCVDKYEASVWQIAPSNTALVQKVQAGTATLADFTGGGATQLSPSSSCSPPPAMSRSAKVGRESLSWA